MADAKYGRLFTEREARRLILTAASEAIAGSARTLNADHFAAQLIEEMTAPTFPADEPLFLLRGRDVYAPGAVEDYLERLNTPLWHRMKVMKAWTRMLDWQAANRDRVKVPD